MSISCYSSSIKSFLIVVTSSLLLMNACQSTSSENPEPANALFEQISASHSGLKFNNQLQETDSFNVLFYEYYYNGSGVAVGDLNNDGLTDVFFGGNMVKSALYLNQGDLRFKEFTEQAGINTSGKWITGVNMVDLNHDGYLDLYVCAAGNIGGDYGNLCFINNGDPENLSFRESGTIMGIDDPGYSTQAAFFDYDLDGDLDLYILTSSMAIPNKNRIRKRNSDGSREDTDKLFRNQGVDEGTGLPIFEEVSREAGILWDGFGLGLAITDINQDGWPDIYVANDYITNDLLYINQQDGSFVEEASQYFKHTSYSAMGTDIADINNDGLPDIVTVDMLPEDYYRKRIMAGNNRKYNQVRMELEAGYHPQNIRNSLQLNNGNVNGQITFSEIGQLAGIHETDWSWAPLLADFDNDGFRDLFIANGIPHDLTNMDFSTVWASMINQNPNAEWSDVWKILMKDLEDRGDVKLSNYIFRNSGQLQFENKSQQWGIQVPTCSAGAAYADFDNDGDLDLITNNLNDPPTLYRNRVVDELSNGTSNYLQIVLSGSAQNPGGYGSKLWIFFGGQVQYLEHNPVRGFQSSVEPRIHFGLGDESIIDSVYILWPDGKSQVLPDLAVNQQVTINYDQAVMSGDRPDLRSAEDPLFKEVTATLGIDFRHQEREFVDFQVQPLILHQYSKEGPGIGVGDINGDHLEDFFIGNGTGRAGRIYLQTKSGQFRSDSLPDNANFEDMGALLFDADSDGDLDLYVASGGTGLPPGHRFYQDRIYLNDGTAGFQKAESALPEMRVCGSKVAAADFDRDGDLDLFVCGRVDLENYPLPTRSYLLRNDSDNQRVRFTDVSGELLDLKDFKMGLLSDALWTDYDLDGWVDLMLAGEWMPLTILQNREGYLTHVSSTGLEQYSGWWNSLAGADIDQDGDTDYIAGNLGQNSRFKASGEYPVSIFATDFDQNGIIDPIITYHVQQQPYPIHNRDLIIKQLPHLQRELVSYENFARSNVYQIFDPEALEKIYYQEANYFNSAVIENNGDGSFAISPLPVEAQFAPVFGILAKDYNQDGFIDLLLTGNSYSADIETGNYDAFTGLFLNGDGTGSFTPVGSPVSGFFVDGDAKGLAELRSSNGESLILAAQNSGSLRVFQVNGASENILKLQQHDFVAELSYPSGKRERREFYLGGGYLSGSSRILHIPDDVSSIQVTTFSGEVREINLTKGH